MITVAKLKELLSQVPDDATLNGYEGIIQAEGTGIAIHAKDGCRFWWIQCSESHEEETFTTGFD